MSRRPLSCGRTLAVLAAAAALLCTTLAHADTCAGLSLVARPPAAVGDNPAAVAVGDFDRDGKMDVAVANSGSDNVSILLGDGTGGFTPGPGSPISTGLSNPVDIAVGDLDGDGILDLVVALGGTAQAQVMQGLPTGGFNPGGLLPLGAVPTRIYLGNFTADADLDLVVVSEGGQRLLLFGGATGIAFGGAALTDISLTSGSGERPAAATVLDFNRNGRLDLAVVVVENLTGVAWARVYLGDGAGGLTAVPQVTLGVGAAPRDVAAGDIDRDGWPDIVTANSGASTASVLFNTDGASLTPQAPVDVGGIVGAIPTHVALVDLDHDGILDLAALDDSGTPRLAAFRGLKTGPAWFDGTAYPTPLGLPLGASPRGLAPGRFTSDGRVDLVTALSGSPGQVLVAENQSGTPCAGTSFARAPRAYAAGNGPVASAAADFDGDGRADLAVATEFDKTLRLLKNVAGHFADFAPPTAVGVPGIPTAVATGDLDSDGNADVVAAMSGPDQVQVFRGDGMGGLTPRTPVGMGAGPSALVIGDFDGNGFPDVAATSEGSDSVFVYRGDGLGGLTAVLPATPVGDGPRALVVGFFDAGPTLDLAVANEAGDSVTILLGDGDGTFTEVAVSSPVGLGGGDGPAGIAAANIDGDMDTDLVTVNGISATASVLENVGGGVFSLIASHPVPGPNPTAVALLDLSGDPARAPELAVTSRGNGTLTVFTNIGGTFVNPYDYPVRTSPRAITPIDADADGRLDLAVPCKDADSVVLLLSRPPALLEAARVAVGDQPHAIVAADLDGDGDLDLAVPSLDDTVSLRENDGTGAFTPFVPASYTVGQDPESIVAADFNRDGRVDLVLNASGGTPGLSILFGSTLTAGQFVPQLLPFSPPVPGALPDDLAAGDFDRDGDLDLAVCDKRVFPQGSVHILENDGSGAFSVASSIGSVGASPTAIVAGDFDRDGDLDLAVANEVSPNLQILTNNGLGGFALGALLLLDGTDRNPLSITAGDLDGDGDLDLAASAFDGDRVHVYLNQGAGAFDPPVPWDAPATLQFVTAADLDLDGKPDLAAVAAGLVALRRKAGPALDFEPPETWIAGLLPWAAAVGDFNRDGRPDAAVVNQDSDNVSVLLSTTCLPRRLEVTDQPLTCDAASPYLLGDVKVEARDDGGNLAVCSSPTAVIRPTIAAGTGEFGAVLGPPAALAGVPLTNGSASFIAGNGTELTIDRAGRRYRLQFTLEDSPPPNLRPALSRPFTLGPGPIQIVGQASFCAPGSAIYGNAGEPPYLWDDYRWTLDGAPVAFTPTVQLQKPPLAIGPHTLGLTTRLDGCSATAPLRDLYVGDLVSVALATPVGSNRACVGCISGSVKALPAGGGLVTYRWGYRAQPGVGVPTVIPGETADVYVLKGAHFPGPGTYYVTVQARSACTPTELWSTDEWLVIIEPNVPSGEVRHLAAASRGTSTSGENLLLWVNTNTPQQVLIRWNVAPLADPNVCQPPASDTAPADDEFLITAPVPNMKASFPHSGLLIDRAYCYSVFVMVGGVWSPGRTVKARPFDSTAGPVKWAYATSGTAVTPPTVSGPAILAMSNDRTVHALTRGSNGGQWPPSWTPTELVGVAHSRSPVVPFTVPVNLANTTVLFATDDNSPSGFVHAIDVETGGRPWPMQAQPKPLMGAPAGMFTQYGGIRDLLFVGTRDNGNPNELRALTLTTGAFLDAYSPTAFPGPIGPISGMPAIDYATRRIYFASRQLGSGHTLWCLDVLPEPPATPVFSYKWSRDLGNIIGSPVLRGGRVYIGTDNPTPTIYSLNAETGAVVDDHTFPSPNGPVKGFLFPDRSSDDLIFATDTTVWSLSDTGPTMSVNWQWAGVVNPSVVLFRPQSTLVYVGGPNATLYQLDFSLPTTHPQFAKTVTLGGGQGQIGAPSLDIGTDLLIVGSESGALYGVQVPF